MIEELINNPNVPDAPTQEKKTSSEYSAEDVARLKRLRLDVINNTKGKCNDDITNFAEILQEKYPDHREYAAYDILIGSNEIKDLSHLHYKHFDFSGDDSIENYLRGLK